MKALGIDYGTKKVGIALSDEDKTLAFPREVIPNNNGLVAHIVGICENENIDTIVVGESLDYSGRENIVMKEINEFIEDLKKQIAVSIVLEPEFMTSVHARKLQGVHDMIDASAAAIILQTYLDKQQR